MDFIEELAVTPWGNQYILSVVDYFSRILQARATKSHSTTDVVGAMMETLDSLTNPIVMYIDQEQAFMSNLRNLYL